MSSATGDLMDFVGSIFLVFSEYGTDLGKYLVTSIDLTSRSIHLNTSIPLTAPGYNPTRYSVISAQRSFISPAEWNSTANASILFNLNYQLPEHTLLQVLFWLNNVIDFRSGVVPQISVGGSPRYPQTPMETDGSVLRVSMAAAPAVFDVMLIQSNSQVLGGLSTVTVTLESSYDIPGCLLLNDTSTCEVISISGLTQFATPDQVLSLGGSSATWFLSSSCVWSRSDGLLELVLLQRVAPGVLITFNVTLRNSYDVLSSPSVPVIQLNGAASFPPSTMNSSLAAPIFSPRFITTSITPSSDVAGSLNTLTLSFETNTGIETGSSVNIDGLVGSLTSDGYVSLFGPQAIAFGNTARFFQSNGTLALKVVLSVSSARFSFQIRNPTLGTSNASCSSVCSNVFGSLCPCNTSALTSGIAIEVNGPWKIGKTRIGNYTFIPKTPAGFSDSFVLGSSSVTEALNTISISLSPNFEISQVSTIVVQGLIGFGTPDAPCRPQFTAYQPCLDWRLEVESPRLGFFDLNATIWVQDAGILYVSTIETLISAENPIMFSFALRNSATFHSGLTLDIGLKGDSISVSPAPLPYCSAVPCLSTNLIPAFMFTDISSSSSLYGGTTTITVF